MIVLIVVVDAIDEEAAQFYEGHGFVPVPARRSAGRARRRASYLSWYKTETCISNSRCRSSRGRPWSLEFP